MYIKYSVYICRHLNGKAMTTQEKLNKKFENLNKEYIKISKKRINIMISDDHQKWCEKKSRKESKENKANVSGYIAVLIEKDKQNETRP